MAMFGPLNKTHLHQQGPNGEFKRGSFYFREKRWGVEEMAEIMYDIASRSVQYYFSKYGENNFI
jgi:type II restriction enzyme